jgi:N-acetylglucosaminyl-diphospho-decaprenol L-rhamnosyltransferase
MVRPFCRRPAAPAFHPDDATMNVAIIIVNYRTAGLTIDCLASLAPERALMPGLRVILTDNASGDDSVEVLGKSIAENGWADWVDLRPLPRNGGFAYGNNEGIREALAVEPRFDSILLLNPDTYIRPGAVRALADFLNQHPDVGIVGSRLEDPDGTPQCSAFRFPTVASEFEQSLKFGPVSRLLASKLVAPPVSELDCPTGWVAGASMLIHRSVFDAIGLLDESFFMYYEEVDFCLRAARAGFPCWYAPGSRVVHLVGQASGVTNASKARRRRPGYWFDSRRRFFIKNYGRTYAVAADLTHAAAYMGWKLRCLLTGKKSTDPERYLRDLLGNNALLRGIEL